MKAGHKWEGIACLVFFALAALVLRLDGRSPIALITVFVVGLLGTCFGLSYMRTWKGVYRNVVLAILLIISFAFYLVLLLPSK